MKTTDLPHIIQSQLELPLPGEEAQFQMAHVSRKHAVHPPKRVNRAGVMALLYPKKREWHLVFIERVSNNPKDRHRGQIGFPGGRFEEEDGQMENTALRETEEEIGVRQGDIQVLGSLTELYIPVSNFLVHPFVGVLDYAPAFTPQVSEVKSVLEFPFLKFVEPRAVQITQMTVGEGIALNNVPYFDLQGKVLWGATAMMLSELLAVYKSAIQKG